MSENQNLLGGIDNNNTRDVDPETSTVTDWRNIMKTFKQKLSYIYKNTSLLPHDVTFLVTTEDKEISIGAHSFVLALSSPVLEKLVVNHQSNDKQERHTYLNVSRGDEKTVKCFLEFLYCGKADLTEFNHEEIMDLVTLAYDYKTSVVIDKGTEQLVKLLTVQNSVGILEFLCRLPRICKNNEHKCFDFILRHPKKIMDSESFVLLSEANVCKLLSHDDLRGITELHLFEACLRWGIAECERRNLSASALNMSIVISKPIRCIRFPLMTPDEFSVYVVTKNILTPEEITDIILYISVSEDIKSSVVPQMFSTTPRTNPNCTSSMSSKMDLLNELDTHLNGFLCEKREHFFMKNNRFRLDEFLTRFMQDIRSSSRKNIRTFTLENVCILPSEQPQLKSIRLSSLYQFTLQLLCSRESEKSEANALRCNFRRYLFFSTKAKYYPWPCLPQYLWAVGVDILLRLNGVTFLQIDHSSNTIVINGLSEYFKILESCKNESLKCLSISLVNPRSVLQISPFVQLNMLCIHNVGCIGEHSLLPLKNINLTDLILHKCNFASINLALIAASGPNLKRLSISYSNMTSTRNFSASGLPNLEYFTLWNCSWSNSFLKSLQQLAKLKSLCVNNEGLSGCLFPIIHLFMGHNTFCELTISGSTWGITEDISTTLNGQFKVQEIVREFLGKFGILKNKIRLSFSNSLDGNGVKIQGEEWCVLQTERYMMKLMYERFGFTAFFERFECFEEKND